jgi:Glycosyl hydrolase family 115/Gylcosyl hydrolase family 115 C-terminal domain/Glycosyl hydrolase family 67 N-terminus
MCGSDAVKRMDFLLRRFSLAYNRLRNFLIVMNCVLTKRFFYCSLLLLLSANALALGRPSYIVSTLKPGAFPIVEAKHAATIFVDSQDYTGVQRAAEDLQKDIARVTNCTPELVRSEQASTGTVILIGTMGKSPIIDRLVSQKRIDAAQIAGKWESFLIQVVSQPIPGITRALVIAGSDKRGTIYGIYDVSEQIGVSPWYWWADVPVHHRDALFVKPGRYVEGEPAVQYRGIFLNDEAPSLSGWVKEKYGNYNHDFYEKVFELLLRLKANYLWPAMWNNAFNEDDPLNPKLADEYGIIMGTSHHEPMLRAQQEWKRHGTGPWDYETNSAVLQDFWTKGIERNKQYESTITIGMRGDGDKAMSPSANIELLEKIVADQRKIIAKHSDPARPPDPEVWALYKEVQEYYEKGMRIPEDVTLLWCDDNWDNIRRLPTAEERERSGGAGIYYHLDYVGGPRSYKWVNTVPITKTWEQMNLAYHYGANRIWIVNVGDLKPMEFPIEFFLDFARDPERWPKDKLDEFARLWATREFGPAFAPQIAEIVEKYTKYNGRRKPELLDPDTFSQANYREADTVLAEAQATATKAEQIYKTLPTKERDAFYELVLYPARAAEVVTELYITIGKNHLYASQGRASTNDLAAKARELFREDAELSNTYNHVLAGGKWNHMMDQTHIGYTGWNEPPQNTMPDVKEVSPSPSPEMGVAAEGSATVTDSLSLSEFDSFNQQRRYVDLFNRGSGDFSFTARPSAPWINVSSQRGTVEKDQRLWISIDWSRAPQGLGQGSIEIAQTNGKKVSVAVSAFRPEMLDRRSLSGFVEANGYVSIEAAHYTRRENAQDAGWEELSGYGHTLSAMTIFPVDAPSATSSMGAPHLEYQMYLFHDGEVKVDAVLAPTLNFVPGRGLRFAVSFDDQAPKIVDAMADTSLKAWERAVSDDVRHASSIHSVTGPGYHTLKIWMVDPGVVLEKLVVDLGGVKPSYLGPPESYRGIYKSITKTRGEIE